MNVKDHTKSEHTKSETFHFHRSRRYADRSDALAKLAAHFRENGDTDAADGFSALADIDKSISSVENERADHHREAASLVDSLEEGQPYTRKAAGSDGLVPTEVRGVIPSVPAGHAPDFSKVLGLNTLEDEDLTLVPRTGQPIQQKPNVSVEFEDLVKIGDDED
jgi:hypothetical protein